MKIVIAIGARLPESKIFPPSRRDVSPEVRCGYLEDGKPLLGHDHWQHTREAVRCRNLKEN